MMDALALVAMYEKGAIVAHELVVRCLLMVDPDNPALILNVLPEKILSRMLEFAGKYRSDRLISSQGGPLPSADQVEAARRWIETVMRKASAASSNV